MQLQLLKPSQTLNKAYLKEKTGRAAIEIFKTNLLLLISRINEQESEEHLKNVVSDFLKDTWYKGLYEINTKDRKDLVIHTGKTSKEAVGVILEVKKPSNKVEMISGSKPNAKALHEMILYYLRETTDHANTDIKYLIITNIYEWYIFDENWFLKNVYRNAKLKKDYDNWKLSGKDTRFFYENIAKPFVDAIEETVECTWFDIRSYNNIITNSDTADDKKLIALYKILSPVHLLKQRFANDSNSLDTRFYAELLYIIGLEEVKEGGKKLIQRKAKPDHASLLENAMVKIHYLEKLGNVQALSTYGSTTEEQTYNIALELCITWINRILFLKLLEAQLYKYHKADAAYLFLNSQTIYDFDELSNLFFQVLAEKTNNRRPQLQAKFKLVPYLNSSLFDRTVLEKQTIDIGALDNRLPLPLQGNTVLKDAQGKRSNGTLPTLQYLFEFLDAYDFTSEGAEEIQEDNKNLINASVLGLIFEKINGYKDGSFFTPGFVTMYMCRETIRRAVYQKFNDAKGWNISSMDTLYNKIDNKTEANAIINSLTICDPAVGSGHFLVSALNEIIAIKSELQILVDRQGKVLRDYEVEVVNDELIVTFDKELIAYNPNSKESQRIQETLFHEKQTVIENCLFGVDINPNSVKICRLRLWIELLKSAYYKQAEGVGLRELETLPNIDINIKCGNSLISRFALDADIKAALRKSKWNIESYKIAVQTYRDAESKEEKREMETLIETIKKDFRSEISVNDKKIKALSKLRGELFNLSQTKELFDEGNKKNKNTKKKIDDLSKAITQQEEEIEAIKNNKIYDHAFEWRFEFPEVLNGDGDFVGFDVVIGNPPYVQLQKLDEAEKMAFEKQGFETYTRTGDIYQLFYEHGVNLIKKNGRLCYITSNKWMRTDYGKGTRNFLATKIHTELVVDFGMAQMFDAATTYTNILLLQKSNPSSHIRMSRLKDDYDTTILLEDYVDFSAVEMENPGVKSWIAYEKNEYALITKIISKGKPLKDWDIKINRGILTGLNEAFIINTDVRNKLVAEDPKSAEIICPILRGEDIKAYHPSWADKWLINTHNGIKASGKDRINVERDFPAVYSWLLKYESSLIKRLDKGDHWSNLRNCAYMDEFYKPKIIYPNMTKYLPFVYDKHQFFTNDKSFIITGEHLDYLTAFLNSKIFKFTFKDYFPELLGESRELRKVFFETVSVKKASEEDWFKNILNLIEENKSKGLSTDEFEQQIDEKFFDLYELTKTERRILLSSLDGTPFTTVSSNEMSLEVSE